MEEIKKEFTDFIKALVSSYPKIQHCTANLALMGEQSRDFNGKVQSKINQLISDNPEIEPLNIKLELAPIRAKYRI